ncbi:branched-chain amino acid ABC transporter permease [Mesorhizobium sp. B2-4-19]|uniref:branched-chain amino acid ABC transporter permease n=1 Tax=Mesorhizobium sp. B2-4-19 TaxID=2589930 RepID=UPI001129F706|nr:branched-chain amino acid ABC transporter permease [Mesorhizobium sp. B2-4-19]TPK60079.1 branched-chain amino acid ABC transporter permease [Mesorhizobium sp. B2-4-19]
MTNSVFLRRLGLLAVLVVCVALLAAVPHLSSYYVRVVDSILIYIILAVGLNLVVGYAGLLDLGFIAFYAVGAYAYALLASGQFDIHLPFILILLIGGLVGGVAGILLGFPVLKLRGDYLAIVTLSFGEIIRIAINNADSLTNGPQGIAALDRASLFGLPLTSPVHFYWLLLLLAIIVCTCVYFMERSILGKAWRALREDQDVVRGLGINTTTLKLAAFAISATIGGAGGVIFGSFQRFVSPESFTFQESLLVVLIIIIGGVGNIVGVIAGAIVLVVLPEVLHFAAQYRLLIYGVVLVSVIVLRPTGLVSPRYNLGFFLQKVRTLWLSPSTT